MPSYAFEKSGLGKNKLESLPPGVFDNLFNLEWLSLARISHTVTAEGFGGSVGAEFLPREQVEQEQAALRPCFREARVAGTAA